MVAGAKFTYETERFPYTVTRTYTPDFVFHQTGIIVEAKGRFTGADRAKTLRVREAIEAEGWELRFLFMNASNTITKSSKTTYGEWCDKHEFMWAEGDKIPEHWFERNYN